jgi:hypothetical protein
MSNNRVRFDDWAQQEASRKVNYEPSDYLGGPDATDPFAMLPKVHVGGTPFAEELPPDGPFGSSLDIDGEEQKQTPKPISYVPHLAIGLLAAFYLFLA